MKPEGSTTPEISSRSTKQDMLKAYKALLKQIETKGKKDLKPEKLVREKENEKVLSEVKSFSTEGVAGNIHRLQLEIGTILTQLSDRLGTEVGKFDKIEEAIRIKEEELKEIYEIDKSAASLAALIEAHDQEREQFEEEMKTKQDQLLHEIAQDREEWKREKQQYSAKVKEDHEGERKKREREKEEYKYVIQREKQLIKDQSNDEKNRLLAEKEIVQKEISTMREQAEKSLSDRESAVQSKEEAFNLLQEKAENFPGEMEDAISKAVKASSDKIRLETDYKSKISQQTFEGEKNVLKTRIESFEKVVKEQAEQIVKLSKLQEMAYQKVQDVAVKAIEGASNSASYNELQKLLRTQTSKQDTEK